MFLRRLVAIAAVLFCPLWEAHGQKPGDTNLLTFPDSAFVVLMDDTGIAALAGPEGAVIDASQDHIDQIPLATLSGVPSDTPSSGRPGIYLTIPAEVEKRMSGHAVTVTVVARRPPGTSGNRSFSVSYSTADVGNSGWHKFELSDDLASYSFDYEVPTMDAGGLDFVGILPDPDGSGGAVEIAAIAVAPTIIPARSTAFYDLAVERVALPPVESYRGALAKVGHLLLYAAQKGTLYAIATSDGSIHEIDLAIPLQHENKQLARFLPLLVSVYDIAAEPSSSGGVGRFDLYASYLGIDDEAQCVFLELSKAVVAVSGDELEAVSDWKQVFRSEPCLALASMPGPEGVRNTNGGRIDFDNDGIILTIGFFNADAQADDNDYGKVIRLDRTTFDRHTISKGHRNPQGLFVDSDGVIFESEHGPQGGDEVNIIVEGKNYGWPVVTYGTAYGQKTWCLEQIPCDPEPKPQGQGRHLGFEQPIYAFVPSIATSQLIKATRDGQFPIWQGDILLASLAGHGLYRLHLDGRRVVVVESIPLGARLRDMVELDDGRIAILTDERELLIVSNAEKNARAAPPTSGETTSAALLAELIAAARAEGDEHRGEAIFDAACASCHFRHGDRVLVGPALTCAFGGSVAASTGFAYSASLKRFADMIWAPRNLDDLLNNPASWTAGTSMETVRVAGDSERAHLIAYLAEVRDTMCQQ